MKLYQDFYRNFVPGDSGFSMTPQLLFVCEDDKHMAEVFKEIITNNLEIPELKLYYTTDLKQNNETLEDTLTEFVLDESTNKYKIGQVKLKLLE